jgi:hypothetical protein
MTQIELLAEQQLPADRAARFELGRGYALHLPRGPRAPGDLSHRGSLINRVNLRDKAERRLLVVELLQHGVNQTHLAEALKLSRQTLHNYRESYREFGVQGLLHGYSPAHSKDEERQRHIHVHKRRPGSKARELEALRRTKREQAARGEQAELAWDGEQAPPRAFALEEPAIEETLGAALAQPEPDVAPLEPNTAALSERPYAQSHEWEASRYAGIFPIPIPILMVLVSQWQWLARVMGVFGNAWRRFMVFVLMGVRNIRSIEQLKHARRAEAGRLLGLGPLPWLDTIWGWFHSVAEQGRAAPRRCWRRFSPISSSAGWLARRCGSPMGICCPIPANRRCIAATTPSDACPLPVKPTWSPAMDAGASSASTSKRARAICVRAFWLWGNRRARNP